LKRLVSLLIATYAAFGIGLGVYFILEPFEEAIQPPPNNDVALPAYRGLFGWPWGTLAHPLIGLSAGLGFLGAQRAYYSRSALWRYHIPFFSGLSFIAAALFVVIAAGHWGG